MTLSNRKPLFLALALTLAAPLAFAQSTTPQAQPTTTDSSTQSTTTTTQDPAAQSAQPTTTTQSTTESSTTSTMPTGTQGDATAATQDAAATATQDATAATQDTAATATQDAMGQASGQPQKKNWSDLDVDKNGTLSVTEAASVQSLAKAFTEADANADGQLTQDEYKAYLAANGKGSATPRSGG